MQMAKIADSPVGRVLHDLFNSVMDPAIICYSTMQYYQEPGRLSLDGGPQVYSRQEYYVFKQFDQ